jgi:hypothetical protein
MRQRSALPRSQQHPRATRRAPTTAEMMRQTDGEKYCPRFCLSPSVQLLCSALLCSALRRLSHPTPTAEEDEARGGGVQHTRRDGREGGTQGRTGMHWGISLPVLWPSPPAARLCSPLLCWPFWLSARRGPPSDKEESRTVRGSLGRPACSRRSTGRTGVQRSSLECARRRCTRPQSHERCTGV